MIGDDDFLKLSVFPSRVGGRAGNDVERSMENTVLNMSSFTTRIVEVGGKKIMLRTRGGAPEFTLTEEQKQVTCIKGPFVEQDPDTVPYVPRGYHPDTVVSTWKNLVSITVRRLKYVVLKNAKSQLARFSFRATGEAAPSGMPKGDLEFDESAVARSYYPDDDSLVVPYAFPDNNNVYARFKAVLRPIKKISCLLNKSVTFAEPDSSGTPPATPGCVRDVLVEPYASTRSFTSGWLREQDLVSGTGLVHLSFFAGKGFLSPLTTGSDLACAEIPAIGTRIIGVRKDSSVKRMDGAIRDMATHERAYSPFIYWLKPKTSTADPDSYGNVSGLLWRPGLNIETYGPDVVVGTSSAPFPTSILRVNSDDSVWQVTISSFSTSSITLAYHQTTGGSASGTITTSLTWGSEQAAALAANSSALRVITDISSSGDKFILSWVNVQSLNVWSNMVMALEISVSGDFPTASATTSWVFTGDVSVGGPDKFVTEPGGVVEGCFYDTDDSLKIVLSLRKTEGVSSGGVSATSMALSFTDTFYVAVCAVSAASPSLPGAIDWHATHRTSSSESGSPIYEGSGTYNVTRVDTYTDLGSGATSTSTSSYQRSAAIGDYSGSSVAYPSHSKMFFYAGPKLMRVPTAGSAFAIARRGVRVAPSFSFDATVRSDGSVADDDSIANFPLYNPVEDSVAVVAFATEGFPQTWVNKINFV